MLFYRDSGKGSSAANSTIDGRTVFSRVSRVFFAWGRLKTQELFSRSVAAAFTLQQYYRSHQDTALHPSEASFCFMVVKLQGNLINRNCHMSFFCCTVAEPVLAENSTSNPVSFLHLRKLAVSPDPACHCEEEALQTIPGAILIRISRLNPEGLANVSGKDMWIYPQNCSHMTFVWL